MSLLGDAWDARDARDAPDARDVRAQGVSSVPGEPVPDGAPAVALPDLVRAWAAGWVVSRGASEPVEVPWGLTFDVGLEGHPTRHVLPDADEAAFRRALGAITGPATQVKLCLEPEAVAPWLAPGWSFGDPGHLMTAALRPAPTPVPVGYRLRVWSRGGITRVMVVAADGAFAARGQIAPVGTGAVVDQVETAQAHRRKGLGGLVMRTLQNAAAAQGATTGLLGATDEGRALYASLGWQVVAPLVTVVKDRPAV